MATVAQHRAARSWNPADWVAGAIVALLVMGWWKRLCYAAAVAMVVGLGAHLLGALSIGFHNARGSLPASASSRASLFAQAWAAHDQAGMMRFVRPADEGKLQAWIAANPVPATVAGISPADRRATTIWFEKDDMDGAAIHVRVANGRAKSNGPPASGIGASRSASAIASSPAKTAGGFVLRMMWSYSGGQWLFAPDASVASTSASHASAAQPVASSASWGPASRPADPAGRPPVSSNVVIPTMVPPWARSR